MTKRVKRLLMVALSLVLLEAGVAYVLLASDRVFNWYVDDRPGTVIGNNPQHKRESQLPECNFTGADFVEEPCYSPPGSMYF